ncbi:MAG: efflux RND transporter permease subunit [Nitrospiraceae bacterium]|nr:efflux RND transporter permease subunit [Nitrospiraceae bacterium]
MAQTRSSVFVRILSANLKNPYPVFALVIVLLVWGTVSFRSIPRDIFPHIPIPVVMIATFYPGMDATEVERNITDILERQFTMAREVDRIESRSLNGMSLIKIIFHSTISEDHAVSMISELSLSTLGSLPPGTNPPMVISYSFSNVPLCHLLISSATLNQAHLYDLATNVIRPQLGGLRGVSAPPIFGGKIRQFNIELNPFKLQTVQLAPLDVVNAIYRESLLVPTGNIRLGPLNYYTKFEQPGSLEDIRNIPVATVRGASVFVRDLASVHDGFAPQENLVLANGVPQVVMPVYREGGYSALTVIDEIRDKIKKLRNIPKDLHIQLLFDQTLYIRESISSVIYESLFGLLAAFVVLWIVLGDIRQATIGVIMVPLSILGVIILLRATGSTLNIMTLGGVAVAIGPMIDHLVLMLESFDAHKGDDMTQGPLALLPAMIPVAPPSALATGAMSIVFLPIFFLHGLVHFLFAQFVIALIGANLVSLLLSLTVLPWIVYALRRRPPSPASLATVVPSSRPASLQIRMLGQYEKILEKVLGHPVRSFSTILLVWFLVMGLSYDVPVNLYPSIDTGQFRIFIHFPSGLRLKNARDRMADIESSIRTTLGPGVRSMIGNIGIKAGWSALFNMNSGTDTAILDVALRERNRRPYSLKTAIQRVKKMLDRTFPNIIFIYKESGIVEDLLSRGAMSPITVEVHGDDYREDMLFAKQLSHRILGLPGVLSTNVFQRERYPTLEVSPDRALIKSLGSSSDHVARNLLVSLNGNNQIRPILWINPQTGFAYYLSVFINPSLLRTIHDLKELPAAKDRKGHIASLQEVAGVTHSELPEALSHDALDRAVNILVFPVPGKSIKVSKIIGKNLASLSPPKNVGIRFVGMTHYIRQSFNQFYEGILMAVFFLYLLLLLFYRSFLAPLVVLGTIPLGIAGSLFFLKETGASLNLISIMGILMSIGIVTSNSIILVNRILEHRREGASVARALRAGSRERVRPVLITTIVTIFAMIPISFVWGTGSENSVPMSRAIIGGLLLSTPITLLLTPLLMGLVLARVPGSVREGG